MIQWRKSSYSGTGGTSGDCVELADLGTAVGLRDSKDPDGPGFALTGAAFRSLVQDVKEAGSGSDG
ncbi:DUF397 domain-containing protein [Spirillospora sp. CA-253888]